MQILIRAVVTSLIFCCSSTSNATTILIETNRKICEQCIQNIQSAIIAIPDIKQVFISERLIAVELNDDQFIDQDTLEDTIMNSGYEITQLEFADETIPQIKAIISK